MTVRPNWVRSRCATSSPAARPGASVQPHDQRDDFAELHAGRFQRVGGLQPVAALDATPTLEQWLTSMSKRRTMDAAPPGDLDLILRRHAWDSSSAPPQSGRAAGGRCSAGLVNLRRTSGGTPARHSAHQRPAGSPAATLGPVLGEGRSCRNPARRAASSCCLRCSLRRFHRSNGRASTDPGRPRPASTPPAAVRSLALVPHCGYRGDPASSAVVAVTPQLCQIP